MADTNKRNKAAASTTNGSAATKKRKLAAPSSAPSSSPSSANNDTPADYPTWPPRSKPVVFPVYRKGMPPGWTSGHPPEAWEAAVRFYSSGGRLPEKLDPIGLFPGGLFETAEDVQRLLDLDTVPETFETVTIPLPGEEQEPEPLTYCWIPLGHMLALRHVAVLGEEKQMLLSSGPRKGKLRLVDMPMRIRDKRKLRNGKVPPFGDILKTLRD